jgi:hypothetical protein
MKVIEKTRLKNLNTINYSFQGLTDKIHKTHQKVLAKQIKDRVRSVKTLGWGLSARCGIFLGGYLQEFKRRGIGVNRPLDHR